MTKEKKEEMTNKGRETMKRRDSIRRAKRKEEKEEKERSLRGETSGLRGGTTGSRREKRILHNALMDGESLHP